MRHLYVYLVWFNIFPVYYHTFINLLNYGKNQEYFYMLLSVIMSCVYFLVGKIIIDFVYSHIYTVCNLRKLFYHRIENARLKRWLDSIFLFKYYLLFWDSGTHQNERRKNYIFALIFLPLTLIILFLVFVATFVQFFCALKVKSAQRSGKHSWQIPDYPALIHFEELPLSFHDRFFELQSPLTKKRLKQIYPRIHFDKFLIDKLHLDAEAFDISRELVNHNQLKELKIEEEIDWKNINESWNFAQSYFEFETLLVVRFWDARKNNWNLDSIKKLKIAKTVILTKLKPMEFQHLFTNLNLNFISELEIKSSNLSLQEIGLIKELNLKSIYLSIKLEDNGYSNREMIEYVMQIFGNIPKIRIFFDIRYDKSFDFDCFLVDWIIKNGYREYFSFTFRTPSFPWYLTFSGESLIISGFNCFQLPL